MCIRDRICPLHGPILTENLGFYIDKYNTWSSYQPVSYTHLDVYKRQAFRIDERLDDYTVMFCNILRDADKVDIFRVNVDTVSYTHLDVYKRQGVY